MIEILKVMGWMLFSIGKFLFAPSALVASGYGFWETLAIATAGGVVGIWVFYFLGSSIFEYFNRLQARKKKPKKVFTKKNKLIVRLVKNYGLTGLCLALGVISIPLSALLAARYFRHRKDTLVYLSISVLAWALLLTAFSLSIKPFLV
ncbi:MAG TPA: hypothetical protein DCS15_08695 [Flavobacteriales bacterium]|nr:hypothetical protein [Flavobacteriales bacterium]